MWRCARAAPRFALYRFQLLFEQLLLIEIGVESAGGEDTLVFL
jgi:hypothetical protein